MEEDNCPKCKHPKSQHEPKGYGGCMARVADAAGDMDWCPCIAYFCKKEDDFFTKLEDTLCHVAQLINGWHEDGTVWSEWDETVRKEVQDIRRELEGIRRG